MKIGVLWSSQKENEKRYSLHWKHIQTIDKKYLDKLVFEINYPITDNLSKKLGLKFQSREEIFRNCNLVILPKPTTKDYGLFKTKQILWGWPHSVQGESITEEAIAKKLTLIAWENMFQWDGETKKEHIFSRNNELAGYAAVNHFMQLLGITPGVYGEELKVAVLGFGSTAKGAINCVLGLGATDLTVFSKRDKYAIVDAIKNVKYKTYKKHGDCVYMDETPSYEELNKYDLIINCVLQNPLEPQMFLKYQDIVLKDKKKYIIDISCDSKMGFDFAQPTTFEKPLLISDKYIYYSVDHTPTYYWEAASYEISGALLPYLLYILKNDNYRGNCVLEKAVDIEEGIILNQKILKFQNRSSTYPYKIIRK